MLRNNPVSVEDVILTVNRRMGSIRGIIRIIITIDYYNIIVRICID